MKNANQIFNTIETRCNATNSMYTWYVNNKDYDDDLGVVFDVRDKATHDVLCHCGILPFTMYSDGEAYGNVEFNLWDGFDFVTFDCGDYKCEIGSIYMNDVIDMAINILYR